MIAELLQAPSGCAATSSPSQLWRNAFVTMIGFAIYGFALGVWRSPLMGVFVAIKMPLLIALTLGFNSLLNGLLGTLLGARLDLPGSLNALLGGFAISALILGSLAPVALFLTTSLPPPDSNASVVTHSALVLTHTLLIAIAGLAGVLRLGRLLETSAASPTAARATLAAWILGNAFLGSQFAWILRPFFGSPKLDVTFLRPNPMAGSFHETLWSMVAGIVRSPADLVAPACLILVPLIFWWMLQNDPNEHPTKSHDSEF